MRSSTIKSEYECRQDADHGSKQEGIMDRAGKEEDAGGGCDRKAAQSDDAVGDDADECVHRRRAAADGAQHARAVAGDQGGKERVDEGRFQIAERRIAQAKRRPVWREISCQRNPQMKTCPSASIRREQRRRGRSCAGLRRPRAGRRNRACRRAASPPQRASARIPAAAGGAAAAVADASPDPAAVRRTHFQL